MSEQKTKEILKKNSKKFYGGKIKNVYASNKIVNIIKREFPLSVSDFLWAVHGWTYMVENRIRKLIPGAQIIFDNNNLYVLSKYQKLSGYKDKAKTKIKDYTWISYMEERYSEKIAALV